MSQNNSNTNLGGGFSLAGLQSVLAKRVQAASSNMGNSPIVPLNTGSAFPQGVAHTDQIPDGVDSSETGEVTFDGKNVIVVHRDEKANNLPWAVKYCNPTAERDEAGRNKNGVIVANAWKSESRVKDLFSALSLIRRNVLSEVSDAMIVESGKIVVNFRSDKVSVMPVILGGTEKKPIVQKGQATILVGDRKFPIAFNTSIDFMTIKQTGGSWFAFQKMGSMYRHTSNANGDQLAIYEFVVEILGSGKDVFCKGLTKFEVARNPMAIMTKPELLPYYNQQLNRFYTFAMYVEKVLSTLTAGTTEEAVASYEIARHDAAVAAVQRNLTNGMISGSVAETKMGELKPASDLLNLSVNLDSAWVVSEIGASILKSLGKKAVTEVDGNQMLDLSKINGTLILAATNATTHQPAKGVASLKISSTAGIKGTGKNAVLDPETAEGKQNLRSLAVLSGSSNFSYKVAWKIASYEAASK